MSRLTLLLCLFSALSSPVVRANEASLDTPISIRLMHGESTVTLRSTQSIIFSSDGHNFGLRPGVYTLKTTQAKPARQRFHLFGKTFQLSDAAKEAAYMADIRAQGYSPEVITIGRRLKTASGRVLDTRVHWISIRQAQTNDQAQTLRSELAANGQPVWIQAETLQTGAGFIQIQASGGAIVASFEPPLTIRSSAPIEIDNVDTGFWNEKRKHLAYAGEFSVRIGPDAKLEVLEILPIEEYLRGVLPAEMPSTWEREALKAQAISARTEVIASLGSRYTLQGFDFLGNEQSRAYLGAGGFKPETDQALIDTRGQFLTDGDRIVPTVFSATCGGWTENNDTVWYGPPDSALRGVSGAISNNSVSPVAEYELSEWIESRPESYCSHDQTYFRWTRRYSSNELRDMISARYEVGQIKRIELGDRGVSGRLKWVRIHGTRKVETIHKELPIRLAFGGLPSALFVLTNGSDSKGDGFYEFHGGGRGHGVGLCQNGAQGMARRGMNAEQILKHFFTNVELERYQ